MKTRIFAGAYSSGKIDPRNHRKITDDFSLTGNRQRIFIVQARPVNIDRDIALRQATFVQSLY
ncbi:Uncharacterised protein [Shigella flexneri]|nr:Uncharacterised protein [Shigella flexneri]